MVTLAPRTATRFSSETVMTSCCRLGREATCEAARCATSAVRRKTTEALSDACMTLRCHCLSGGAMVRGCRRSLLKDVSLRLCANFHRLERHAKVGSPLSCHRASQNTEETRDALRTKAPPQPVQRHFRYGSPESREPRNERCTHLAAIAGRFDRSCRCSGSVRDRPL